MGIRDWLRGEIDSENFNEKDYISSLAPISEELEQNVKSYVENNYGKPYIGTDEIIKAAGKICEESRKASREKHQTINERTIVTDEDYDQNEGYEKPKIQVNTGSGVRYSISSDADRQQLSKDADNFYSTVKNKQNTDPYRFKGFVDILMDFLNRSGMENVEVYKKANLSRSVFSKIISDRTHIPKKGTIIALAVALELNLKETETLLMKAGYTFSNTLVSDLITVYFITHKIYDIDALNRALYDLDQPILGSKSY